MNSNELFDQVDKNNDGAIQLEEWIEFWTIVFNSGYSEDDLIDLKVYNDKTKSIQMRKIFNYIYYIYTYLYLNNF